jgi:hypothetical protein
LILSAGPFDFSWHLKFGLDGLLSPPHVTLLTGWMLVGLGNLWITNNLIDSILIQNKKSNNRNSADNGDTNYHDLDNLRNLDYSDILLDKNEQIIVKIQLILNLSFILVILSGFIYFFSLPFSETQFYNYNPNPLVALFVYGFGFPFLLSSFFISILKNYQDFKEMILFVGSFYIIIMLLTEIISNPFLIGFSWYYILNIIPFVIIYLLNKKQTRKTFTETIFLPLSSSGNLKNKTKKCTHPKIYIFYALILAIFSFTICFPLNTYILNEELYGYLVYQNLVSKVYTQLFADYFIIVMTMSIVGGLLGYGLVMSGVIDRPSLYDD